MAQKVGEKSVVLFEARLEAVKRVCRLLRLDRPWIAGKLNWIVDTTLRACSTLPLCDKSTRQVHLNQ